MIVVDYMRRAHCAHYAGGGGHDLETWTYAQEQRLPVPQQVPADAEFLYGANDGGAQRWTYARRAPLSAGTCVHCRPYPKVAGKTHDNRVYYAADSVLPDGAAGWTQLRVYFGGAYSVRVADDDLAAFGSDLKRIREEVASVRTKRDVAARIRRLGGCAYEEEQLVSLKAHLEVLLCARRWPLRLVS